MSGAQSQTTTMRGTPQLPAVLGDHKVLVLTGWAGAGKGTLFNHLLSALSSQLSQIGAVVNEKSDLSAIVDSQRLDARAKTKAIAGCACCTSIDQILQSVSDLHHAGAKLTIVEQSPLSRTARILQRLRGQDFSPVVVALVNPRQIEGARSYIYPQIRAADVVILTHIGSPSSSNSKEERETRALITELTKDLRPPPLVLTSKGSRDTTILTPLWEVVQRGSRRSVPPMSTPSSGESLADQELERRRLADVENFSEMLVETYRDISDAQIRAALSSLRTNPSDPKTGVAVIRGKGIIAGQDIDVTVDSKGLHVKRTDRNPEAPRFDGKDFLLIRTLDPRLFDCWGSLYASLGTQECDPAAVAQIVRLYPSPDQIRQGALKGELSVVHPADSLLWDLIENLPYTKNIPEEGRKRQVGQALIDLLGAFLDVRAQMLQELSPQVSVYPQLAFDAAFVVAKVLSHPYLQQILGNPRSPLFEVASRVIENKPEQLLCRALSAVPTLMINDRQRLTKEDVEWLQRIGDNARKIPGRFNPELAQQALTNVRRLVSGAESPSWNAYLPDLSRALIGG